VPVNSLTGQCSLANRAGASVAADRDPGSMQTVETSAQTIETPHFLIRNGRVRRRFPGDRVSNELADHIAAELGPLGLVPDGPAFERLFVEMVQATHPDPARAWAAFYGNTLRRLRRPDRAETGSVATFGRIYRHAAALIRGHVVLDVGCCFGFLPLLLAERSPRLRVVGADLTPAAAALAARMARERVSQARFAAADLLALPVADQAVDTVLAVHVLEHLPAAATAPALAQLCRVARRRVVVAVPLEDAPDPVFGHVQAFDLGRLAGIAAGAGDWARAVYAADGGWLVLDRPDAPPTRSGRRRLSQVTVLAGHVPGSRSGIFPRAPRRLNVHAVKRVRPERQK
jgi:SAM-dependent methyltransferase